MTSCILNSLIPNKPYSFEDITDIIDLAGLFTSNDYNIPKSNNGLRTNGEISLSFVISALVKQNRLVRLRNGLYYIP